MGLLHQLVAAFSANSGKILHKRTLSLSELKRTAKGPPHSVCNSNNFSLPPLGKNQPTPASLSSVLSPFLLRATGSCSINHSKGLQAHITHFNYYCCFNFIKHFANQSPALATFHYHFIHSFIYLFIHLYII